MIIIDLTLDDGETAAALHFWHKEGVPHLAHAHDPRLPAMVGMDQVHALNLHRRMVMLMLILFRVKGHDEEEVDDQVIFQLVKAGVLEHVCGPLLELYDSMLEHGMGLHDEC